MTKNLLKIAFISLLPLLFHSVCAAEPYNVPNTSLSFPDKFANLDRVSAKNYELESPGLGSGIGYSNGLLTATIYVYDLGYKNIPSDPNSKAISDELENAARDVHRVYQDVYSQALPTKKVGNSEYFARGVGFIFKHNDIINISHLHLFVRKGKFIKIRLSSPAKNKLEAQQFEISADLVLKEIGTLLK
jgi:hypothetical protein